MIASSRVWTEALRSRCNQRFSPLHDECCLETVAWINYFGNLRVSAMNDLRLVGLRLVVALA
jgi:hypothetical protein